MTILCHPALEARAIEISGGVHKVIAMPEWTDPNRWEVTDGPLQSVDQTKYRCPQCAVVHQRDSGVGARHAHLFYGGSPAVVHLEHCPVLEDAENGVCNCNAVPASAADRATERRQV